MPKLRTLDDLLLVPAGGGDYVKIAKVTLASAQASIDFTGIPQGFRHLEIRLMGRGTAAATSVTVSMRVNSDSTAIYDRQYVRGAGGGASAAESLAATSSQIGDLPAASATASVAGGINITIFDYARTVWQKAWLSQVAHKIGTATGNVFTTLFADFYRSTNAVTSVTLVPSSGNFDIGTTATLYGLRGGS